MPPRNIIPHSSVSLNKAGLYIDSRYCLFLAYWLLSGKSNFTALINRRSPIVREEKFLSYLRQQADNVEFTSVLMSIALMSVIPQALLHPQYFTVYIKSLLLLSPSYFLYLSFLSWFFYEQKLKFLLKFIYKTDFISESKRQSLQFQTLTKCESLQI